MRMVVALVGLALAFAARGAEQVFDVPANGNPPVWEFWTVGGAMDLAHADGVEFDFCCDSVSRFGNFFLRLHTSDDPRPHETGYHIRFMPDEVGKWCHIRLRKVDVTSRMRPCGTWSNVTSARLIGERGGGTDAATVKFANLRPIRPAKTEAVVVLSETYLRQLHERRKAGAERWCVGMTRRMQDAFDALGVPNVAMSDVDLAARGLPPGVRLASFIMSDALPEGAYAVLTNFSARGGRQLWTRSAPPEIRRYLQANPSAGVFTGLTLEKDDNLDVPAYAGRLEPVLTKLVPVWTSNVVLARAERAAAESRIRSEIRAMPRVADEMRILECHRAFGPWPEKEGWDGVAKFAKDCGFTALDVNVATGPIAWYPSKVLRPAKEVAERGDAVDQLVRAGHANGLKVSGWRCCFVLKERDYPEIADEYGKAGRLTVDDGLRPVRGFLCPVNRQNREEDVAAFAELAGKGLDAVDMDFIRYYDRTHCCCPTCRTAFEAKLGKPVADWPADVYRDESEGGYLKRWQDFRVEVITGHIREIRAAVKAVNPEVELWSSCFPTAEGARRSEGQDWANWCREGLVDRIAPMDYSVALTGFENLIVQQKPFAGLSRTRVEPSFGPVRWNGAATAAEKALVAARHIEALRRNGYGGYAFFQLTEETKPVLELLAQGPHGKGK